MLVPRHIAAVTKLCAKESTRYAFDGVLLQRKDGKPRAVATDGRRMIVAEWEEPDAAEYPPVDGFQPGHVADFKSIIQREDIDRIAKATDKGKLRPVLGHFTVSEPNANGTIRLGCTDLRTSTTFCANTIEGTFPPYEDVIPDYPIIGQAKSGRKSRKFTLGNKCAAVRIGVNPKFLAECAAAVAAIGSTEESKGVELIVPTSPNRPMLIRASRYDGSKATAVLMPVNLEA